MIAESKLSKMVSGPCAINEFSNNQRMIKAMGLNEIAQNLSKMDFFRIWVCHKPLKVIILGIKQTTHITCCPYLDHFVEPQPGAHPRVALPQL